MDNGVEAKQSVIGSYSLPWVWPLLHYDITPRCTHYDHLEPMLVSLSSPLSLPYSSLPLISSSGISNVRLSTTNPTSSRAPLISSALPGALTTNAAEVLASKSGKMYVLIVSRICSRVTGYEKLLVGGSNRLETFSTHLEGLKHITTIVDLRPSQSLIDKCHGRGSPRGAHGLRNSVHHAALCGV